MNCPNCNSASICEIIYGYIHMNEEIEEAIKQRKMKLGGCVIGNNSPKFSCNSCSNLWGDLEYD